MVEVGIGGGEGAEALVVAAVVVVVDEGGNGGLELARQEVVLPQDAVLQGLAPALDVALGLGVFRSAADVGDARVFEPASEIARDTGRFIVAEQPGPMDDLGGAAARGRQGELQRVGHVAGAHGGAELRAGRARFICQERCVRRHPLINSDTGRLRCAG